MSITYFERPKRTNAPMQPRTTENKKMNLKECITCGSHEFNGAKCAYCGNVYEIEKKESTVIIDEYHEQKRPTYMTDRESLYYPYTPPIDFQDTLAGKKTLKVMILILVSIIWFAITVFIPPLFILTICSLIIWACKWFIKKGKNK